ncbi:AEC family transporter [Neobacillus niacini]|uniref:AEC family transporter n=1 Tax=Neobacillus niacini TaxID=86668 RepID=UPI003983453D
MYSSDIFFQEMFVLYGMALLGFLIRKKGILNEHANDVLTQLILNITLPALILFSLDISFSYTIAKEFLWLVSMSAYILLLSILLAIWMSRRSILDGNQKSVYQGLIIFGNQGFIGYAVVYILLGEQGIIYLTIFNLCYLILIWTYGIYLFNKGTEVINWRKIFMNPGILFTLTGLLIFFLPVHLPDMLSRGLESVGKMTVPLSMMMIGLLIADVKRKDISIFVKNIYLWKASFIRLLLIPMLLLPFALLTIPYPLLVIAVLVSGMPAAPTISLYAQKYNADTSFSSLGVLFSTLLCMITIPFLYFVLTFIN